VGLFVVIVDGEPGQRVLERLLGMTSAERRCGEA